METPVVRKLVDLACCPLCRSTQISPLELPIRFVDHEYHKFTGTPGYSTWQSCGACSLVFQNPIPNPDALGEFYRQTDLGYTATESLAFYKENSLFFRPHTQAKARHMLRLARRTLGTRPRRVLELGCGFGKLGRVLREWGYDYVGVDPSELRRECAREFGLVIYPDFSSVRERDFDLVISNHVLEHVPDPADMLRQATSLCAPRCTHVHVLPTHASGSSPKLFEAFCLAHLFMFSHASFARVYANAGLTCAAYNYGPLAAYDSELWTVASSVPLAPRVFPPIDNGAVLAQSMQRALARSSLYALRWKLELLRLRTTAFFFRRFGDPVYRPSPAPRPSP